MKRRTIVVLLITLAVSVSLSGCGLGRVVDLLTEEMLTAVPDDAEPTLKPTALPSATAAPTRAPMASPTLPPVEPQPLTEARVIYQSVAPSIAYIDTPTGTGSGIMYAGGYIVTNFHVVWPYDKVRVVLTDGSEYLDAPVIGTDPMVDLAVIGPIASSVPEATFASLGDLQIGDTVYLIGYPGEGDAYPQPALTRGLVSLMRDWSIEDIAYIQSDAAIAGGQSGGALVAPSGQVIGISGFSFSDVFALVASAQDLTERIDALIAGDDPAGLEERNNLLQGRPLYEDEIVLANYWDTRAYVIDQPLDTSLTITLDGRNDGAITLVDSYGDEGATADENTRGLETLTGSIDWSGPYFVIIEQYTEGRGAFTLESDVPLIPVRDPDDQTTVVVGSDTAGNIDYPGDVDVFEITLGRGESVVITVDSVMIDAYLTVDFEGATENEMAWDDDSGYGLFALNASLEYTAPQAGTYYLVVEDAEQYETGGYHLIVTAAPRD